MGIGFFPVPVPTVRRCPCLIVVQDQRVGCSGACTLKNGNREYQHDSECYSRDVQMFLCRHNKSSDHYLNPPTIKL